MKCINHGNGALLSHDATVLRISSSDKLACNCNNHDDWAITHEYLNYTNNHWLNTSPSPTHLIHPYWRRLRCELARSPVVSFLFPVPTPPFFRCVRGTGARCDTREEREWRPQFFARPFAPPHAFRQVPDQKEKRRLGTWLGARRNEGAYDKDSSGSKGNAQSVILCEVSRSLSFSPPH